MPDTDAVLFANEAFYQAFAERDIEAMEELWSRAAPVSCIHPGWGVIFGREEVMRSWIAIITSEGAPQITYHGAVASLYGDTAFVVCFEMLGENVLIATNVFVREGHIWKIVHHQAGPTSAAPPPEEEEFDAPVH
jgi:hypothetical protein